MTLPDFSFEKKLWRKGYKFVAGVDEVGRGCFAGPIVAGCVVFRQDGILPLVLINDSKKLSPKQREIADRWIRKNALAWGVGEASVNQINRLGIKKTSEIAFRRAIVNSKRSLPPGGKLSINYLLIDAFYIPFVRGLRRKNQKPIIKGDTKSLSIAAASIVAKVYRDKLMAGLAKQSKYKKYGWGKNKGYGTKGHQKAITKYGLTRLHRKKFVQTWINNSSFSQAQ